jgi:hypothetical protein
MHTQRKQARRGRNAKGGSGMAEFAPALMVLVICIFFPLVDFLAIGLSYGLVRVLNYNQCHEASLVPWGQATDSGGTVMQGIPNQWGGGMGHFVKMSGDVNTVITYRNGEHSTDSGNSNVQDKVVQVATTVTCNPFLPIPFPSGVLSVPGMNGPFTFTVFSERPMENPDNAP